ncbi:MAG: hypothetical protein IT244_01400 [Bacteroidia bacterium]|nr:hypothetical protein [Bacteroidia bacterium]
MRIKVLDTIKMDGIPSGSGIVKSGNSYHIVGDDSPFLFSLNSDFEVISKIPLLHSSEYADQGRIIKSEKPDFETAEMIAQNEMVIFGSGSKSPQRDVFIRILLDDAKLVEKYNISDFYKSLKNLPEFKNSELNIEATAFHHNQIFLFNRKKNLVIQFDYTEFLDHLKGETALPQFKITPYTLPKINGIEAGFSGATALKNAPKIIFTASVENTNNAYDDGEILGSFIGMIDIFPNGISETFDCCQIPNVGDKIKVESVSVEREISSGKTKVVLITDDDKGNSVVLKSLLEW